MPRGLRGPGALCGALLLLAAPAARGHDMWIAPDAFRVALGETVRIGLRVGHGSDVREVARSPEQVLRFDLVGDGGTSTVPGLDGSRLAGAIRPPEAGSYALVYQSRPRSIELDAERFERYLLEEGLEHVVEERAVAGESALSGRERYARALKALVTVGDVVPRDRVVGLPFEIVIERMERSAARGGFTLTVRVLRDGTAAPDVLVEGIPLGTGAPAVAGRTDAAGNVTFTLGTGRWMLAGVHMARDESRRADWSSIWAATTFELPARDAAAEDL